MKSCFVDRSRPKRKGSRSHRAKVGPLTLKVTPADWVRPDDMFIVSGGRCYLFRGGALVGERSAAPMMEVGGKGTKTG